MLGSVNMFFTFWVVPRFEIKNEIGIIILGEEEKDGRELVHGCTINF